MMTDPLMWSPINLGRWAGVQVRVHFVLISYVVLGLLWAIIGPDDIAPTAASLGLLLLVLLIHEAGHAAMAWWQGSEAEDVRLWPLGNMVGPSPGARSPDNLPVTLAGPAISLTMVVLSAISLNAMGYHFVWSPFGNGLDPGAPSSYATPQKTATALTAAWYVGWFGYLNWVLFVANVIPALPFDGGRAVRAYLANSLVTSGKDGMLAPLLARSFAIILGVVGLFRLFVTKDGDGVSVLLMALLIELMVRAEARMYEDGGFFDDGVFGYDFSEGYTSLEGNTAKVRPYRESALKRWRRRRSELRRQRRQAREAAEERRMDEILEKLYREGRSALTDEEHRFLVRVSVKYRNNNKPRARD